MHRGASSRSSRAATNLVALKTNSTVEAYVLDRDTGVVNAESRTDFGESPNGDIFDPSISADGARVSYESVASNLAAGCERLTDVLVRDPPVRADPRSRAPTRASPRATARVRAPP